MSVLRSKRYLSGSRGATCKFHIPGVCTGDVETVIPAHIRDRHTGRSIKASDLSVSDACFHCHEVFDRRAKLPNGRYLTEAEWAFYALRGLQDTLEARRERGLLIVSEDTHRDKPTKARKPPADRKPIPQRADAWPEAPRPIQSRPFAKRTVQGGPNGNG